MIPIAPSAVHLTLTAHGVTGYSTDSPLTNIVWPKSLISPLTKRLPALPGRSADDRRHHGPV